MGKRNKKSFAGNDKLLVVSYVVQADLLIFVAEHHLYT